MYVTLKHQIARTHFESPIFLPGSKIHLFVSRALPELLRLAEKQSEWDWALLKDEVMKVLPREKRRVAGDWYVSNPTYSSYFNFLRHTSPSAQEVRQTIAHKLVGSIIMIERPKRGLCRINIDRIKRILGVNHIGYDGSDQSPKAPEETILSKKERENLDRVGQLSSRLMNDAEFRFKVAQWLIRNPLMEKSDDGNRFDILVRDDDDISDGSSVEI